MNIKIIVKQRWRITVILCLLISTMTGCATVNYGADYGEQASFDSYQSFAWIADGSMNLGDDEQLLISHVARKIIVESIEEGLTGKGFNYMEDSANADFLVAYSIGMRGKIVATSKRRSFRGPSSLHRPERYFNKTKIKLITYTEGTLGIDMFDRETKQRIWQGWASKSVTNAFLNNPLPIDKKAIAAIIQRFPPSD